MCYTSYRIPSTSPHIRWCQNFCVCPRYVRPHIRYYRMVSCRLCSLISCQFSCCLYDYFPFSASCDPFHSLGPLSFVPSTQSHWLVFRPFAGSTEILDKKGGKSKEGTRKRTVCTAILLFTDWDAVLEDLRGLSVKRCCCLTFLTGDDSDVAVSSRFGRPRLRRIKP